MGAASANGFGARWCCAFLSKSGSVPTGVVHRFGVGALTRISRHIGIARVENRGTGVMSGVKS